MNLQASEAARRQLREAVKGRRASLGVGDRGLAAGLIGRGIEASRTPAMHEREGARVGLPYCYVLIDFDVLGLPDDALETILDEARALGLAGVNVTHPFKQTVIAHLDALSPEAAAIGAVNTVVFGPASVGHNTDSWGFAESFRETMADVARRSVLLLGAGGAGAAVAHALTTIGVENLLVGDTDGARAAALSVRLTERFGATVAPVSDLRQALATVDGLVNATPMGMKKYPGSPVAVDLIGARHWVADIVYFPAETELLRDARALGCRTLSGTGMAVYQAVRAFELFTGVAPDRRAMGDHFSAVA